MNKRKLGTVYEQLSVNLLKQKGYIILECNYRCMIGEVDIIALDKQTLVFIEVKYRKNYESGYPEEAVSRKKMRRICKTADWYCLEKKVRDNSECRFDVIAIDGKQIRHYKNAFLYCGDWK